MHIKLLVSGLLLFLTTNLTAASNCPEYNLYNDNQILDELGIKDQGLTGMCYAVTASDMMNYELKRNGSSQEVSPFWLAMSHKKKTNGFHWTPDSMSYSLLSWSYSHYLKSSHCSAQDAEQKLNELSSQVQISEYNIIQTYELLWRFRKKNKNFDIYKFLEFVNIKSKSRLVLKPQQVQKLLSYHSPLKGYRKLIHFYKNNLFKECQNLTNESLDLPQKVNKKARSIVSERTQERKLLKTLENEKDSPVAIGYCANILRYPNHRVPNRKPGLALVASKKCYAHYSLLVGARSSKNKCEVLIRNSYGEKFWANEAYECYCQNRNTNQRYNCRKDKFDINKEKVLGCWLPSRDLAANTFELNYL